MSDASIDWIVDIAMSFMASNALMTATELDVFSIIGDRPQTSDVIARSAGVDEEESAFVDLLDGLVALRLLEREGDAEDAHYLNSPSSAQFLNRVSERFFAGGLMVRHQFAPENWNIYAETLRAGDFRQTARQRYDAFVAEIVRDHAKLQNWFHGLAAYMAEDYRSLAETFDFSAYETLLDISCGVARLPVEFGRLHPHLRFIAFDQPPIIALAREYLESKHLHFRVESVGGDFLKDKLPTADVAVLCHVLRRLDEDEKDAALRQAYQATPDDGAVVVMDVMCDEQRRNKWYPLLLSVQLQLEFGKGRCMTPSELERKARRAGFERFEHREISANAIATFMYK